MSLKQMNLEFMRDKNYERYSGYREAHASFWSPQTTTPRQTPSKILSASSPVCLCSDDQRQTFPCTACIVEERSGIILQPAFDLIGKDCLITFPPLGYSERSGSGNANNAGK
jgi:hypothetical protein